MGAGFAFAISLGEFGATLFIARPDTLTIPVAIFRLLGQPGAANFATAMALATVLMVALRGRHAAHRAAPRSRAAALLSGPMLTIRGLLVAYQGEDILRGIDLDVPAGQLLCVLGPSGGGKSTLLRAIAGLEEPRAGSLHLEGRDLAGVPAHERGVGLMFQDYALFPHRDVGQNVAFGLRMRGVPSDDARARVAELLDPRRACPDRSGGRSTQLSGGEQQRVALARALAPRPRLLMLDEPMGSLDRSLRERLPEELRAIFTRLGLTTIYVTHDQDEALSRGRPGHHPRRRRPGRRRHARAALAGAAHGLGGPLPGLPQRGLGALGGVVVWRRPGGRCRPMPSTPRAGRASPPMAR